MSLWGFITGKDKKKQFPDQQAKFLKVGNYTIIYPYGSYCDLPNDVYLKEIGEGAAIPVTVERVDTETGEPSFFHPVTQSRIIFRNNGDIEVVTATDVNVTCNKLKITGDLEVTGTTTLSATVTSNGKDISDTHTHTGVQSGASNTGPVT